MGVLEDVNPQQSRQMILGVVSAAPSGITETTLVGLTSAYGIGATKLRALLHGYRRQRLVEHHGGWWTPTPKLLEDVTRWPAAKPGWTRDTPPPAATSTRRPNYRAVKRKPVWRHARIIADEWVAGATIDQLAAENNVARSSQQHSGRVPVVWWQERVPAGNVPTMRNPTERNSVVNVQQQRLDALERAVAHRTMRARMKAEWRDAGELGALLRANRLVWSPPEWARTMTVVEMMTAIPKTGLGTVHKFTRRNGIQDWTTLTDLTQPQVDAFTAWVTSRINRAKMGA